MRMLFSFWDRLKCVSHLGSFYLPLSSYSENEICSSTGRDTIATLANDDVIARTNEMIFITRRKQCHNVLGSRFERFEARGSVVRCCWSEGD
jgi:hypothetical protein